MTKWEQDTLKKLLAKQKAEEKLEKEFWEKVDERKAEILSHWEEQRKTIEPTRTYDWQNGGAHA